MVSPRGYVFTPEELREFHELQRSFWWFVGRRAVVFELFRRFHPAAPRPRIVDIGCGTGLTLSGLRDQGFAVGLDISEDALRLCRKEAACVLLADGAALPFRAGSVDAVFALDVAEHFEDDETVLSEMHRVLGARGVALVTVPAFTFLWSGMDDLGGHYRRYTARGLAQKLGGAGFVVEKLSYFNFFLFPALVAERLVSRVTKPAPRAYFRRLPAAIDRLLASLLRLEARMLRAIDLPVGGSIVALARKRPEAAS